MDYDNCIMCSKPTQYRKNTHVDLRNYYVEGCGQLCKECFDKVYVPESKNSGNNSKIHLLND